MSIDFARVRQHVKAFSFTDLFIEELGWDRHKALPLEVAVDGTAHSLHALAEKRGMVAYVCAPDSRDAIPDYATRRKIEKQAAKSAHEHLIIYTDGANTTQVWQWVKRELGRPAACREHTFRKNQSGDALIQKLQTIAFSLEEEESLTIAHVAGRARQAFDVDRVTKRFYDRFKTEHAAFLKFIKGIQAEADREWYASLMLNRLMFIYFIQKKGFLDGDHNYLRIKLRLMRARKSVGAKQTSPFLTFYRHFLLRLFHEGLGQQPHSRLHELDALLGKVPYLNGGLFEVHELEQDNPEIEIPDQAFERIFDFFDAYQWHLDERPLRADNEINPDVLGYIFEKYINQKQMGAYYTKEDITGYISENTVIPFLFDTAEKKCAIAFRQDGAVWELLRENPDRYLYEAVRRGVIDPTGKDIPEDTLPDFVQKSMHDPQARMFERRYNLAVAVLTDPEGNSLALPTETWREYVERRKRCLELRVKLATGEVHSINDLITYNLDIRQFAQDVIENCEGPEFLRAFWHAIEDLTVLDPTCGSGAFLFAALNILEPLYEACLDRMQSFVDDLDRSGEKHRPEKFADFRKILDRVQQHPNRRYFILKSIIINNLYGVDIMEEAIEICKLRLFLKLVAQVERVEDIEPLPDIDFNIRAGNTLVGFTSLEDVKTALTRDPSGQLKLMNAKSQAALKRIEESAEIADRAFHKFHEMQTEHGMDAKEFASAKQELRRRLDALGEELDRYLSREYGIDVGANGYSPAFTKWRASHQPFHWFVEFYGIMKNGGFDVIIGNPPWKEYAAVKKVYAVLHYTTETCGNLHGICTERAVGLRSPGGWSLGGKRREFEKKQARAMFDSDLDVSVPVSVYNRSAWVENWQQYWKLLAAKFEHAPYTQSKACLLRCLESFYSHQDCEVRESVRSIVATIENLHDPVLDFAIKNMPAAKERSA